MVGTSCECWYCSGGTTPVARSGRGPGHPPFSPDRRNWAKSAPSLKIRSMLQPLEWQERGGPAPGMGQGRRVLGAAEGGRLGLRLAAVDDDFAAVLLAQGEDGLGHDLLAGD